MRSPTCARSPRRSSPSPIRPPAPTRVALGPDAYDYIHEALTTRIAELESLKDISCGVAVDGPKPVANWR